MVLISGRERESDQRTIARCRGLKIAHPPKPLRLPPFQGSASDVADVEATAVDADFALLAPVHQYLGKGHEIELTLACVSVRQAQGHAGIFNPLTRRQAERAADDHIAHMPLITPLKL